MADDLKTSRETFLDELTLAQLRDDLSSPAVVEQRRGDPALRGAYRALYENIPLMVFTLDGSGRVLAMNAYAAEQLGYERAELLGQPVLDVFHPEDRPRVEEQLSAAFEHPGEVARWRFRKNRKDGTMLWVQEAVRVIEEGGRTIALVVCEDVTDHVDATDRLVRYQNELRTLTSKLALAEERERRRIADGLHDQIGQVLAMAKLRLGTLHAQRDPEGKQRTVREVRGLLDKALKETRSLTFELSCPVLYRLGLEEALRDLGERLGRQAGVQVHFDADADARPLGEDTQITLYRVVQELLFNVLKHARAQTAHLSISTSDSEIRISVKDDGVGFDVTELERGPHPTGGLGLFGIRERLDHLGGRLEIVTAPGSGTRIAVSAPLET